MHLEHYEPQSSWRSSMMMFVCGTAVGAVAALMMAPASGRDSRDYLKKQGRRVADDVGSQAERLASAVRWGSEQATTAVKDTVDSAMSQAKAVYNAAKSHRQGDAVSPSGTGNTGAGNTRPITSATSRPMTSSHS
jgi:gas vesicle protein